MPLTKMDHALDAARRGLPVFPQVGKRPSIRNWPANATLKPSVITRWWTRWPGADIGIALPADIYVLDFDSAVAMRALDALALPPTLEVTTARGFHLYFRVPHALARMTGDGKGLHAIEGKGSPGPVTWAGSVHPSGHVYTVVHDWPIATMPGAIVRSIGPKRSRVSSGEATAQERATYAERAERMLAGVRGGNGILCNAVLDAQADVRLALRELHSELPHLASGWADRFFRAGAYLGPHVANGALGLDQAIKELTDLFHELDTEGRSPEHVLRSIERGVASGARTVGL